MHWRDVIVRPVVTEKANFAANELGQYSFVVHNKANKLMIKDAVERVWPSVTVSKVRIANMPAKRGRRWRSIAVRKPAYKKAIVTLSSGTIDVFEGV